MKRTYVFLGYNTDFVRLGHIFLDQTLQHCN